jgi:hypothetical protein
MSLSQKGAIVFDAFCRYRKVWDKHYRTHEEYRRFVAQQERFDLWSISFGLYQSGHSSLDDRFRDAKPLLNYCLSTLDKLAGSLKLCE